MSSDVPQLLRRVRRLELVARRNVSSVLSGSYVTSIIGRGLEFHEARKYVQGESVRRIDWKMTARLAEPWVRTFLEERERESFVIMKMVKARHEAERA